MAEGRKQFSTVQRAFAVKTYLETKSPKQTRALFCREYGTDRRNSVLIPSKQVIMKWVSSFEQHGSVENKNAKSKARQNV